MIANILVNFIGSVVFLFIFWKKLKEDYTSEIIFSLAFIIFAAMIAASLLSSTLFPQWFFWSQLVGIFVGFLIGILKFKMRGYEVFDAVVISFSPWLSFFFLKDAVVNSLLESFIAFVVILIFISIYYLLDLNYKRFTWYKSGRIGFSSLSTLSLFFITRAGLAIKFPAVLSFVVKYEPYLSGLLAVVTIVLVFVLSRREE